MVLVVQLLQLENGLQNQENIQLLYGKKYDIMYELSYKEAWDNKVILKIDTIMFPIYSKNIVTPFSLKNGTKYKYLKKY